jgi:hypothetical protein
MMWLLTTECFTFAKCFNKLWSHFNQHFLTLFKLSLSIMHCTCYHLLHSLLIECEKHITQPLLVNVVPVMFIRKVTKYLRFVTSEVKEVYCSETLNLWYCWNFDCGSLHILTNSWCAQLTSFDPLIMALRKNTFTVSIFGRNASHS